ANAAVDLADLPEVVAVRLPRPALSRQPFGARPGPADPLKASGVVRVHPMGHRGKGTRLAILDADFRGWQALVGKKRLPANTRFIDVTAERNADLRPDPFPGDPDQAGSGTRTALTVMRVAPEVELTLVRVDASTPAMLLAVARALNGERYHSESLDQRVNDLRTDRVLLDRRRETFEEERK